jgi:hypothetical protein
VNWSRSTIANVETGYQRVPRRFWQAAGTALGAGGNLVRASERVDAAARHERAQAAIRRKGLTAATAAASSGSEGAGRPGSPAGVAPPAAADAGELLAWVAGSNTSDEAIEQIASAGCYLAEAHTRLPAAKVLAGVLQAHQRAQYLLRGGRQRLRQTRELLRIGSRLLAHACLLLGDLGRNRLAAELGAAALAFAQEAGGR